MVNDDAGTVLVRVRDVLAWPGLGLSLAGRAVGLERRVRWAQATELLDPSPYLRGGELVLTAGVMLDSDERCREFVRGLRGSEPAAIGYGVDVITTEVPAALVAAADAADIPVLRVPASVPFVLFTERLAHEQSAAWARWQDQVSTGHLLEIVRKGQASPAVVLDRLPEARRAASLLGAVCFAQDAGAEGVFGEGCLVGTAEGRTIVLAEIERIEGFRASTNLTVYGTGGPGKAQEVARIVNESVSAYAIARQRGTASGPRDLASLDGLVQRLTAEQIAPFYAHIFQPLQQHDQRRGTDLVATLRTFLEKDGSLGACARAMYLHPNTVRNRLERVEKITGLSVRDVPGRVALTVALAGADRRGPGPISR